MLEQGTPDQRSLRSSSLITAINGRLDHIGATQHQRNASCAAFRGQRWQTKKGFILNLGHIAGTFCRICDYKVFLA